MCNSDNNSRCENAILLEELTEEAKAIMKEAKGVKDSPIYNQDEFIRDCIDMVERISKFEIR